MLGSMRCGAASIVSLQRLLRTLKEPRRAVDVFSALFARQIADTDAALLGMATGEAVACLNYLMRRGEATREVDADGVAWYRATA